MVGPDRLTPLDLIRPITSMLQDYTPLDIIQQEFPEIFQYHDLPESFRDGNIIIPIDKPGRINDYRSTDTVNVRDFFPNGVVQPGIPSWDDVERAGADMLEPGRTFPDVSFPGISGGSWAGAHMPYGGGTPPPDCLAFYLPFHYFFPDWWGVYILFEGVQWLAGEIVSRSRGKVTPLRAIQAARLFLYYHESFHHKTECFSLRMEVTHRQAFYKSSFEAFYRATLGTHDCLEEGLANARALAETEKMISRSAAIIRALEGYVRHSPLGYNRGVDIREDMKSHECDFAEKNHFASLPHLGKKNPEVWRATTHMFYGTANVKSRVNYILPKGSPLAHRLRVKP
jgi:hypothetical protein